MPNWQETSPTPQPLTAVLDLPEAAALYKNPPPPFGHALLACFAFDPAYINLNHGSYGSLSSPVREACDALSALIERNPDKFNRFTYQPLLAHVRARLAAFVGAHADEVVLVPNASHGLATVLRNFDWAAGDVLIDATTTYNSVAKALRHLADTPPHPALSHFDLRFPTTHAQIVAAFRAHLRAIPRQHTQDNNPQKIVAVIDSIASNPGVLLPWKEMVAVCREEGVWSVVDAAHSIGQEPGLDLRASGCDFWVSNCHKWLIGKRASAVLYVPRRNQHVIRTPIPTPHSYAPPGDPARPAFPVLFEWNGTIDFIPALSVDAALDFRTWLGGEEAINGYCHALALAGGARMAEILGTEVLHGADAHELTLNMVNVALPLPPDLPYTFALDHVFRTRLLDEFKTYVAHFPHNGRVWVRASAQVFNDVSDFEYAAGALKAICADVSAAHERGETV
ncbi:hypothetical protein HWV62_5043 [Athelia sp. TMB]|nr:hypothetical protein HWV62_5043 [Athelia sp. TMB]